LDNLTWLYGDSTVPARPAKTIEMDVARNGTASAQVLVEADGPVAVKVAARGARVYQLLAVPVEKNTGLVGFIEKKGEVNPHVTRRAPFEVFDAMMPLTGKAEPTGGRVALCVQVPIPAGSRPGRRQIAIDLTAGSERRRLTLRVNVHAARIPPVSAKTLKYTNWFSLANMASRHGVCPWSTDHWQMIRKYARLMVYGRQNTFWLSTGGLFSVRRYGPVLDAGRLRRLVKLFTGAGMHYIEGPHLARRMGKDWHTDRFAVGIKPDLPAGSGEGAEWIGSMARQLYAEIVRNGWQGRWMQHVTDEPIDENATDYRLIAGIIRKHMPGVRLIEAALCNDLAGSIDIWVPQNWGYEQDRKFFERQRALGDEIWHYTCCQPGGPYLNRLMDGELLRPALLHWGNALYDLCGFLHWGLNQYRSSQDPLRQSVVPHAGG
ncbi:unnamed protein product, partial [marine sediment metagenome]